MLECGGSASKLFCDHETSCLECNHQFLSSEDTLSLTIDDVEVRNLQRFCEQSGLFEIGLLPEGNDFRAEAGAVGVSLGDGYHVLLAPLAEGEHAIHFTGCFAAFGGCEDFELDITHNITVE